ncbi:hypothetical protein WJX77_009313 [Trebouxia sp. C0004]
MQKKDSDEERDSNLEVQEDWTWQTDQALQRSSNNSTEPHHDEWTAVAKSHVAGHGLFSMTHLPARFVLYAYTGTTRTAEQASRRPNAFQFDLQDGLVCDAGPTSTSSPARSCWHPMAMARYPMQSDPKFS